MELSPFGVRASAGTLRSGVVGADGGFDDDWRSTGVTYEVAVDSPASAADVARMSAAVDDVAEIPRALRAGAPVARRS
ncbi:hypothetical protein GCM10025864_34720 [Luteimicrobium album]|uniref:Uncharacterized protein n=1 Tax=Luteimicrobium album TaxID=1054550 RepID=A0ABQ6I6E0_9MICO|nr:hypothetical protein [Luteimicrobium album]GMA25713.1 hypothetical protein GCM10025864_34720 [Luteimicrobium album]